MARRLELVVVMRCLLGRGRLFELLGELLERSKRTLGLRPVLGDGLAADMAVATQIDRVDLLMPIALIDKRDPPQVEAVETHADSLADPAWTRLEDLSTQTNRAVLRHTSTRLFEKELVEIHVRRKRANALRQVQPAVERSLTFDSLVDRPAPRPPTNATGTRKWFDQKLLELRPLRVKQRLIEGTALFMQQSDDNTRSLALSTGDKAHDERMNTEV